MSCDRAKYSILKNYWSPNTKEGYFVSYAVRGPLTSPSMVLAPEDAEHRCLPCGEMCGIR